LGHYLTSSLSSLQSCINFIKEGSVSKSSCRSILDLAAFISISSSRRIFLVKDCPEWSLGCWQLYIYFFYFCTLPHPLTGLNLISGSVRPRTHPNLIYCIVHFSIINTDGFSLSGGCAPGPLLSEIPYLINLRSMPTTSFLLPVPLHLRGRRFTKKFSLT